MTTTHKRRWQFSLRWLLVLTTILCVVFARVAYFRERAVFHEQEAARFEEMISRSRNPVANDLYCHVSALRHRIYAYRYRRAMYRPFTVIFETPSPEDQDAQDIDLSLVISKR